MKKHYHEAEVANYSRLFVPPNTFLPGYSIDLMPEDGRYYLVSCDPDAHNPWGQPFVLARRVGDRIEPMFSGGSYCGARLFHPCFLAEAHAQRPAIELAA